MSRFSLLSLLMLFFLLQCSKTKQSQHIVIVHNFDHPIAESIFINGATAAAESLNQDIAILYQHDDLQKRQVDSLFNTTSGICFSAPVESDWLAEQLHKATRKATPIIQFNSGATDIASARLINSNYYSAGRAAARYVVDQFGDNGRFGILTPSLDNRQSTDGIRGFRDGLSKSKWKQVNIITCGNGLDQALKQYRYATRFGNRIIWFVADDCDDVLAELKNLKKDNFFIAIDLHPKKNNLKFLQDNLLDALATKDFAAMGRLCVTEAVSVETTTVDIEAQTTDCGSVVLTTADLENFITNGIGESIRHETLE